MVAKNISRKFVKFDLEKQAVIKRRNINKSLLNLSIASSKGGLKIKRVHKINSMVFFKLKCKIIIDIKTDIIV